MRARLARARPYTRPGPAPTGRLRPARRDPSCGSTAGATWRWSRPGLLSVVLPVADDSGIAGYGVFDADLETTRRIMDDDPGVRAGIFSVELHPVRGFPGSCLP